MKHVCGIVSQRACDEVWRIFAANHPDITKFLFGVHERRSPGYTAPIPVGCLGGIGVALRSMKKLQHLEIEV